MPPCPTSEAETVLAPRPLRFRRAPVPQLPLVAAVVASGAMIAVAIAVVGLSALSVARTRMAPPVVVAAPPMPAPLAPPTH
jgi:hypothetical protein